MGTRLSLAGKELYLCHMLPQNQSQQNTENLGIDGSHVDKSDRTYVLGQTGFDALQQQGRSGPGRRSEDGGTIRQNYDDLGEIV